MWSFEPDDKSLNPYSAHFTNAVTDGCPFIIMESPGWISEASEDTLRTQDIKLAMAKDIESRIQK